MAISSQKFATLQGTDYVFTFDVVYSTVNPAVNDFRAKIGTFDNSFNIWLSTQIANIGSYQHNFKALSNETWITFELTGAASGANIRVDNVSVQNFERIERDGGLYLLLEAMGDNEDLVRLYLDSLAYLRDPQRTPLLSDLEKEYGIITNNAISEQARRDLLTSIVYARRSPGSKSFLQDMLHQAGFTNLYVYDNAPAADPDTIVNGGAQIYCGDTLAQCGEPNAQCAWFQGEYVVNGDVYDFAVDYIVRCGETLSQCGEPTAQCGNYAGVLRTPKTYTVPDKKWIFSETFISDEKIEENGGTFFGTFNQPANYGLLFDSASQVLRYIGGHAPLPQFTVIADVDLNFRSGFRQSIISELTGSIVTTFFEFGVYSDASTTDKRLYLLSAGSFHPSTATTTPGRHKLAAVVDGTNLTYYVDGVQLGAVVNIPSVGIDDNFIYIGNNLTYNTYANGYIYDVKLFGEALSQEEIESYTKDQVLRWWNMVFFVGGTPPVRDATTNQILSIPRVSIPNELRKPLKNLILKYKPLHSWCGLVVSFV